MTNPTDKISQMIDIFYNAIQDNFAPKQELDFQSKLHEVCKDVRPVKRFVRKNFLQFQRFEEDYQNVLLLGQKNAPPLE